VKTSVNLGAFKARASFPVCKESSEESSGNTILNSPPLSLRNRKHPVIVLAIGVRPIAVWGGNQRSLHSNRACRDYVLCATVKTSVNLGASNMASFPVCGALVFRVMRWRLFFLLALKQRQALVTEIQARFAK
jgi:hypothetical protein